MYRKRWVVTVFCLAATVALSVVQAQTISNPPPSGQVGLAQPPAAAPGQAAPAQGSAKLSPSDMEDLLSSIALYPDSLLANVLAASVYPDEVAAAAKFVASGSATDQIAGQPWSDPVKAVAAVPEVIKMMGQYPDWTVALGQAYLTQAQDVMAAVQSLRAKAKEGGALETTQQQTVTTEGTTIYIESPDPEVVYVPTYTSAVYAAPYPGYYAAGNAISFGLGVATGLIWANNLDCDWHGGCVGYGNNVNINNNTNINRGNRPGNEGGAWRPDRGRPNAGDRPSQLPAFQGGRGKPGGPGRPGGPGGVGGPGGAGRPGGAGGIGGPGGVGGPGGPGGAPGGPSNRPGAGNLPANRPGAGNLPANRPSAGNLPANRPGAGNLPANRPSAGNLPANRPGGGAARTPAATRRPSDSAFSGGANTRQASQRGASSRQSAVGHGGGGGRSSAARGGGGRSGGGGGRGGGGRGGRR